MTDLIDWLRGCIERDRAEAEAGISDNSPSEVLAHCEAHTAILNAHPLVGNTGDDMHHPRCGVCVKPGGIGCGLWPEEWETQDWPCPSVRAVGLAYQHRPGYRDEWRP